MGRDSASKMVSKLFYHVANSAHSNDNPTLSKLYIGSLLAKCQDSHIKVILEQIVDIFNDDEEIPIFHNQSLNALLTTLASLLSPSLINANKSVGENIKSRVLYGR